MQFHTHRCHQYYRFSNVQVAYVESYAQVMRVDAEQSV